MKKKNQFHTFAPEEIAELEVELFFFFSIEFESCFNNESLQSNKL